MAGAPSHAPWQQQNNILMPAIMANVFGKLMNKIPFSVSFYNSDVLFSCPVSLCIFFFNPHSTLISPTLLLFLILLEWRGHMLLISSQDSMLILLVIEQYSPDIVGRRLSPVWNCHAEPLLFYSYQLLTMPVPSSITLACQLCYLFSKHAFDVFSRESLGLVPQAWHTSWFESAERNLGYREGEERQNCGVKPGFHFYLSSWTVGFALNWAVAGWDLDLIYMTK